MQELNSVDLDEVGGGVSYSALMAYFETLVEAWQGFYDGAKEGYYGKQKK